MTIASVPPPLALGTVAATRLDPALAALEAAAESGAAGVAQIGTNLAATPEASPASPLPQQAAASLIDALALRAAAQAVKSEGGLALLLSDLSEALRIPALPEPVQAAISQVFAVRLPLDAPVAGADLKAALAQPILTADSPVVTSSVPPQSGNAVLPGGPLKSALVGLQQALEAWLADEPAPPAAPSATPANAPNATLNSTESVSAVADPAAALHVAGQSPPVVSVPPTSPGVAAPVAPLPASVAPAQASSVAPPAPAGATGPAAPSVALVLEEAPATSSAQQLAVPAIEQLHAPLLAGAFVDPSEQPLGPSSSAVPITAPVQSPISQPDIEALPPALPQAAPAKAEVAPLASQGPAAATAAAAATAIPQTGFAALPAGVSPLDVIQIFQQAFKAWFGSGSTPVSSAPAIAGLLQETPVAAPATPTASSAPPPPYRGGPTTAQPAVPSSLPLNADPVTIGDRLLRETGAAIAHQELLQIASLPPATQGSAHSVDQTPQWMFEIPFATAQGTAIAQFKITRDGGKGGGKGGKAPVWRALFSLDVEPMGPVHAQIVLSGDRTWVSLWAEREESVARLRQHEALLTSSLKDSNFVPEIAFHAGAPRQPTRSGAHFLNHAL